MADAGTRDLLKLAARRLFALRGFDGVSVRDIVVAAGQRNSGSLHYYFGSKDELARELVADGAKLIDDRRNRHLDAIEARGGPRNLRDLVEILVWPSTNLAGDVTQTSKEDTYIRFITMLQMSHRQLFLDALEGKWASGYDRVLGHIRALLADIDPEILNQRLMLMSLYLRAAMSSREAALEGGKPHRVWSDAVTMENFIDTIEGMLKPKPSKRTVAMLEQRAAAGKLRGKTARSKAAQSKSDRRDSYAP
ncbi:MAG: transcriptional regulator, TetR family [Tardiphaga sp.]|jgi:AcrR family transcriptional regulator|nr:transcriptional regulator, TetR family [Tardiphaga sp.]